MLTFLSLFDIRSRLPIWFQSGKRMVTSYFVSTSGISIESASRRISPYHSWTPSCNKLLALRWCLSLTVFWDITRFVSIPKIIIKQRWQLVGAHSRIIVCLSYFLTRVPLFREPCILHLTTLLGSSFRSFWMTWLFTLADVPIISIIFGKFLCIAGSLASREILISLSLVLPTLVLPRGCCLAISFRKRV